MKKYFIIPICLSILAFSAYAIAETMTFIKEYTYQASDFDSRISSRTIALEQVKRLLLEELGTYLEGSTEVKNFELTKDKIVERSWNRDVGSEATCSGGILENQADAVRANNSSFWEKL